MPYLMGAMMVGQAFMGARQAGDQAMQQMTQQNWNNHIQQMQVDQANRDIATANARQWMNNQLISETANKQMAEQQVYLQYNFDNATGELSRQTKQQNDSLIASMSSRNLKGGTARALMRQQEYNQGKVFEARAISHGNKMRDTERQRDAALAQRNFSYTPHQTFVPAKSFTDRESSYNDALISGLVGAGMQTYVGIQASNNQAAMDSHMKKQRDWYSAQLTGAAVYKPPVTSPFKQNTIMPPPARGF